MAIPTRDLVKVKDVPEVAAAIQALDEAAQASREAYRAWKDADVIVDRRQADLDEVASRALEAWRQEP